MGWATTTTGKVLVPNDTELGYRNRFRLIDNPGELLILKAVIQVTLRDLFEASNLPLGNKEWNDPDQRDWVLDACFIVSFANPSFFMVILVMRREEWSVPLAPCLSTWLISVTCFFDNPTGVYVYASEEPPYLVLGTTSVDSEIR